MSRENGYILRLKKQSEMTREKQVKRRNFFDKYTCNDVGSVVE